MSNSGTTNISGGGKSSLTAMPWHDQPGSPWWPTTCLDIDITWGSNNTYIQGDKILSPPTYITSPPTEGQELSCWECLLPMGCTGYSWSDAPYELRDNENAATNPSYTWGLIGGCSLCSFISNHCCYTPSSSSSAAPTCAQNCYPCPSGTAGQQIGGPTLNGCAANASASAASCCPYEPKCNSTTNRFFRVIGWGCDATCYGHTLIKDALTVTHGAPTQAEINYQNLFWPPNSLSYGTECAGGALLIDGTPWWFHNSQLLTLNGDMTCTAWSGPDAVNGVTHTTIKFAMGPWAAHICEASDTSGGPAGPPSNPSTDVCVREVQAVRNCNTGATTATVNNQSCQDYQNLPAATTFGVPQYNVFYEDVNCGIVDNNGHTILRFKAAIIDAICTNGVCGPIQNPIYQLFNNFLTYRYSGSCECPSNIWVMGQSSIGACCSAYNCTTGTLASCTTIGGAYQGHGTNCTPDPCSSPGGTVSGDSSIGACCSANNCTTGTQANCATIGGAYQGHGTSCTPDPCSSPGNTVIGACCSANNCTTGTQANCATIGGAYQGHGTSCTPDPCSSSPTGGINKQGGGLSSSCSSSWNVTSPKADGHGSKKRLNSSMYCSSFARADSRLVHEAWILDFNPGFKRWSPLPYCTASSMTFNPSVIPDTNLFLGEAKYNLNTLCKLLATNSSRGSNCVPCPSRSSKSKTSASSSSLSSISSPKVSSVSSSRVSSTSSSSKPSVTPGTPGTNYNHYDMYECGTWTDKICRQFYTYVGGTRIRIPNISDKAGIYHCPQNVGPSLEYKITKVIENASTSTCALLIKRSSFAATIKLGTRNNYSDCKDCLPSSSPTPKPSCPCDHGAWATLNGGYYNEYACQTYYDCSRSSQSLIPTGPISSSSSSSVASKKPKVSSSFSYINKCYTAKSSHLATTVNEPGIGASWANYWKECPCCPASSMTLNDLCPLFHVDDEEIKGPWSGREPEHNRNITITQGDTVCYRFAVYDHGQPVNLTNFDIASYIKLNFSDDTSVDKFSTSVVGANVIQLSLTAKQTTCLPVTELIYSCEIRDNTSPIAANNKIDKVIQGYLRVEPEVTRNDSFCTVFGFGPQPKASASSISSSASAKPYCCPEYHLVKSTLGSEFIFHVEVPTEQAVLNDVSYWEIDFTINDLSGGTHGINEIELVQNEIDPAKVLTGYDMVYPIGGGRYRFIDKMEFIANGTLKTVFSTPIAKDLFNKANIKLRYITENGCVTKWCNTSLTTQQEVFGDCCPSSSSGSPRASATPNPNQP